MPRVAYAREQQGYRVFSNPSKALHGSRRLGQIWNPDPSISDPNCGRGMPYDVVGNLCPGVDPNCANLMPYDVNGNPCPGTVQPSTGVIPVVSPRVTAPISVPTTSLPTVTPGGSSVYSSIQQGSSSIFQAAVPWIVAAIAILWVRK